MIAPLSKSPVVAMIHLAPLPGSPLSQGSMKAVIHQARQEARILEDEGFDGLLVENFGDIPFLPGPVGPETVAAMAVVVREVIQEVKCPVGVNVLRNDGVAALSVARAAGGSFIRVNVHTGVRVTDQGIIQGQAHETLRLRKALGKEVEIWADVAVKHSGPLSSRPFLEEAREILERGGADRLIITGAGTGVAVEPQLMALLEREPPGPVVVGSGVSSHTLEEVLRRGWGVIVGSDLREEGRAGAPLDRFRVQRFGQALSMKGALSHR